MRERIEVLEHILDNEVFAVGGCVRDIVLGLKPNDIDFASSLKPQEVIERASAKGYSAYDVGGEKYGTVVLVIGDESFEITTFRSDHDTDGRHCQVAFANYLADDLCRRDFTCNAMAMDSNGNIIDPFEGRLSILLGVIKAVGEAELRFKEDYLRIIRLFRFAARFGWSIEDLTKKAAVKFGPEIVGHVSWERIRMEFDKAFKDSKPSDFIIGLEQSSILAHILPEISALKGVEQSPVHHPEGDAYVHTLQVFDRAPIQYRWAALLHDVGKASVAQFSPEKGHNTFYEHDKAGVTLVTQIADRLKFSNELRDQIKAVCQLHMRPMHLSRGEISPKAVRRFVREAGEHLIAIREVVKADASCRPGEDRIGIFDLEVEVEKETVKPIVLGRHLIELGMKPGPQFKTILNQLEEMQLDGEFSTLSEGLTIAVKLLSLSKENHEI